MPLVEVRNLVKSYPMPSGAVEAVREVSLGVDAGESVALMGPSGSGKSTLLNLIGCLDRPTAGQIVLDGRDVATLSDDQLARVRSEVIGFVFQTFHLLPRQTALQNVELPLAYAGAPLRKRDRQARAEEALARVGLADRMHHLPSEMSGGQQQRVAIARAIINDPKLLLCDEPTGNLDSRTSEEILDLLGELNEQGKTLVIVTHEEEIAQRAQRRILFRDGQVVSDQPSNQSTVHHLMNPVRPSAIPS